MPVRLLLRVELPEQGVFGVGGVAGDDEGAGDLIHVARPDEVIAADIAVAVGVAPGRAEGGDDGIQWSYPARP